MSKLYVDITKDRVYTEAKASFGRRCAQTTLYTILSGLVRMMAPLLVFTAEEIWSNMAHDETVDVGSVFLNQMPDYDETLTFAPIREKWDALFALRDDVMKALEDARAAKQIGKSLDARVEIVTASDATYDLLSSFGEELKTVFIVSEITLTRGEEACVKVLPAEGEKCERCWMYVRNAIHTEDGGCVCPRCASVLEQLK